MNFTRGEVSVGLQSLTRASSCAGRSLAASGSRIPLPLLPSGCGPRAVQVCERAPYTSTALHTGPARLPSRRSGPDLCQVQCAPREAVTFTPALRLWETRCVHGQHSHVCGSWFICVYTTITNSPTATCWTAALGPHISRLPYGNQSLRNGESSGVHHM